MISKIIFLTVMIAFAAAGLFGKIMMPLLMRLRLSSADGKNDITADSSGEGISPGGGAVIMLAGTLAAAVGLCSLSGILPGTAGKDLIAVTASGIFAVICGAVGAYSDILRISGKKNGISQRDLVFSEIILTAVFLAVHYVSGGTESVYIPFINKNIHLGAAYYLLAAVTMLAVIHSFGCAALTDGIMSASSGAYFLGAAMLFAAAEDNRYAVWQAALSGSCSGFLILNFPPAKTGCGRCGAMFAGASAAAAIAASGQFFLLPIMLLPIFAEGISFMTIRKGARPLSRYIVSKGIRIQYAVMFWFAAAVICAAAGNLIFRISITAKH